MTASIHTPHAAIADDEDGLRLGEIVQAIRPHWWRILGTAVVTGALAYGGAWLITPTFTAKTTIISPQQQQSSAAAALSSLSALSGLAGLGGGSKSQSDQYVALMQSVTVSDRILDRFKLVELYGAKFREDARRALASRVRVVAGKKDNLISIEVDDADPERARQMAEAYVEELRRLTNNLALSEAQQRRVFFEQQLKETRDALTLAQIAVQRTGFSAGALKSEPKAAAESYVRIKAEIATSEVRLAALRRSMTDNAPEIQQLSASLGNLRSQLAQLERPLEPNSNQDYVSAYRNYKYQEALFEIYAKQFELAKADEAREGALIQVLDPALKPERKSKPQRSLFALGGAFLGGLVACVFFVRRRRRATVVTS